MTRQVYFVSDATAITAETLARSVLTQFRSVRFTPNRIPFVNTVDKAVRAADDINKVFIETGVRPLVFATFVSQELREAFESHCLGFCIDFFDAFIKKVEAELGVASSQATGVSHEIDDALAYDRRMDAINFTLMHDDGQLDEGLDQAEVILVGVSRCGKTPTSLFLAMQYAIRAANYPLIPEDFERGELPAALRRVKDRIFGLSIAPERLAQVRNERRPDSRYASIENCRYEVEACERLMAREGIRWLNSTTRSIEEIAATIIAQFGLSNATRLD